jgi:hypothetical protein
MSQLLSLLSLPRELIYKIVSGGYQRSVASGGYQQLGVAAEDAVVYNKMLRICRHITSLFPLSLRLDFMISFGVTIQISSTDIHWCWDGKSHDIYGSASVHVNGNRYYCYHGHLHRIGKPASMYSNEIQWYEHGKLNRDPMAPAGTDVEWLRGATSMYVGIEGVVVEWWENGVEVRNFGDNPPSERYDQVCAEIAYWRALE